MKKKLLFSIFLVGLLGVSFAFFNYTRLGDRNTLVLGEIYMHYNTSKNIILENAVPRNDKDDNVYIEFSVDGLNEYKESDLWYGIDLVYGDIPEGKQETNRIRDDLLRFTLTKKIDDNEEIVVLDKVGYPSINDARIYVETIPKEQDTETVHTYKLYVWITDEIIVGNTPKKDYTLNEWNNIFASLRIKVLGDFYEKESEDYIKVTFDANGGIVSPKFRYYSEGDTYGELPIPVRDRYTFLGWSEYNLPEEYQEVEYLESTGIQYIDTGYMINENYIYKMKVAITDTRTSTNIWPMLIGAYGKADASDGKDYVISYNPLTMNLLGKDYQINEVHTIESQIGKNVYDGVEKTTNKAWNGSPDGPVLIFNSLTSETIQSLFSAIARVYKAEIYDGETIVRKFIPCYRKSDNVAGLYDLVNGVFYTNQGTGTFIVGEDVSPVASNTQVVTNEDHTLYAIWGHNSKVLFDANGGMVNVSNKIINYNGNYGELPMPVREGYSFLGWSQYNLPEEYQLVEYIQSSGTQYIDTRIYPKSTTRVITDIAYTEIKSQCSGWGSSGGQEAFMWCMGSSYFYSYVAPSWTYISTSIPSDLNRHIFSLENGKQMFDGNIYGTTAIGDTATSIQYMYLFAAHVEWNSKPDYYSRMMLYSTIIYDGDTMVRNFIPCYRKSDNVAGLYDLVNGVFYTNQGTGTFIVGEDVLPADSQVAIQVDSNTQVVTNEDHTLYAMWQKND